MGKKNAYYLPHDYLQTLIDALKNSGRQCIGPQVQNGAIVYDVLEDSNQLPWGAVEKQSPGKYRLEQTDQQQKAFSWVNGPQAIKPILFKSQETLWKVEHNEDGKLSFKSSEVQVSPLAIIGVRPCDISAMLIQDKVFVGDQYVEDRYKARRENLFIVAVNCTRSSDNCFCVSAGGDTKATSNFDIVMTEIENGFIIEAGSSAGQSILEDLSLSLAADDQIKTANNLVKSAAESQTKTLPAKNLRDVLIENMDHPLWDEIASHCLSCGNCTQVCPTCFCHEERDRPNLDGSGSEHERVWDSCFTKVHSYLHGKPVRAKTSERYRQWLTHKLGSWFDQFGTSGCVGCGRCITWCPVGIDITEEATAIYRSAKTKGEE